MDLENLEKHDLALREKIANLVEVGEWNDEPNRLEFEHLGFTCLIQRQMLLALCGYVGVPPGHPWHGKSYMELDADVRVHGGLTFSDGCGGVVCHTPKEGEPDGLWWFGFDCAHGGDFVPCYLDKNTVKALGRRSCFIDDGTYKNIEYVRKEVISLAEQAHAARALSAS